MVCKRDATETLTKSDKMQFNGRPPGDAGLRSWGWALPCDPGPAKLGNLSEGSYPFELLLSPDESMPEAESRRNPRGAGRNRRRQ